MSFEICGKRINESERSIAEDHLGRKFHVFSFLQEPANRKEMLESIDNIATDYWHFTNDFGRDYLVEVSFLAEEDAAMFRLSIEQWILSRSKCFNYHAPQ